MDFLKVAAELLSYMEDEGEEVPANAEKFVHVEGTFRVGEIADVLQRAIQTK